GRAWQAEPGHLLTAGSSCETADEARIPADSDVPVAQPRIDLAALVADDLDALDPCLQDSGPTARTLGALSVQDPSSTEPTVPDGTRLLVVVREPRPSSCPRGCLPLPLFCEPPTDQPRLPAPVTGSDQRLIAPPPAAAAAARRITSRGSYYRNRGTAQRRQVHP